MSQPSDHIPTASGQTGVKRAIALAVLGVIVFTGLALVIRGDSKPAFDISLLKGLRNPADLSDPRGPYWVEEGARDLTALGGITLLTMITIAIVGFLWMLRHHRAMWLILIATVGGAILSSALKMSFARPRPGLVPHLTQVGSSSFPSGHSMLAAVVYLTLGTLLSRFVTNKWLKRYFLGIAITLTVLVGVSRVYLGVHYPTDVLAGWAAGVSWASCCWLITRYFQRRGQVEQPVAPPQEELVVEER